MSHEPSIHANAVKIGHMGLLIRGEAGSGKTSLSLGLVERAKQDEIPASLVADDRVLLGIEQGRLSAAVPEALEGKVEIRGYGIATCSHVPKTTVDLVVEIVPDDQIERMPDPETCACLGIAVPVLKVPKRHEAQAIRIVFAWLDANS